MISCYKASNVSIDMAEKPPDPSLTVNQSDEPCDAFPASPQASDPTHTFSVSQGYTVVLQQSGDKWKAMVHDNSFSGFSRSFPADVKFEQGYQLRDLIARKLPFSSHHIHLFDADKDHPVVYIGSSGLKGGNWWAHLFGYDACLIPFCPNNRTRCVCGYTCPGHNCSTCCCCHRSHQCVGCRIASRCPKYYTCKICFSDTYCSDCCGCYERQRQERESREATEKQEQERREAIEKQEQKERQAVLSYLDHKLNTISESEEESYDLNQNESDIHLSDILKSNNPFKNHDLVARDTVLQDSSSLRETDVDDQNGGNDDNACFDPTDPRSIYIFNINTPYGVAFKPFTCDDAFTSTSLNSTTYSTFLNKGLGVNFLKNTFLLSGDGLPFHEEIQSLLHEILSEVDPSLKQNIVDYFIEEGAYLDIVACYPASQWIEQFLLRDIVGYPIEDSFALNKFRSRWLIIKQQYSDSEVLLKSLKLKKIESDFSLSDIADILCMLSDVGPPGYSIVCSQDDDWLFHLKIVWLKTLQESLSLPFTESEISQLFNQLADTGWNVDMTKEFLQAAKSEISVSPVISLLSAIKKYHASDALVLRIMDNPYDGESNKFQHWTLSIISQSLLGKISELSPQLAKEVEASFCKLLQTTCSAELLEKFVRENVALLETHKADFVKVLELLYDYRITENVAQSALELLPKIDPVDWLVKVDQQIVSCLFKEAREFTEDELIKAIAAESPNFKFASLKSLYREVEDSYSSPSVLLCNKEFKSKPISSWNEKEVGLWAKQLKIGDAAQVPLPEIIAGVKRAVQLIHGYSPRPVQLLTILTLLHPVKSTGRLVQVNTGQGKSLIAAMLASVHSLMGIKVDIITTSTELSIPEVEKQIPFYKLLGLQVAENSRMEQKAIAYLSDVVYGTASDFQGDILRSMFIGNDARGNRGFGVVIVDEVDSMLFDDRTHSVRLSVDSPGMNHLVLILGVIWDHINRSARHLTVINNQTYFIPEDFERKCKDVTLFSGLPWQSCAVLVDDKRSFLLGQTQSYLEQLLRELDEEEITEYKDYQELNRKILSLEEEISHAVDEQDKNSKETSCKTLREKLKNLPWNDRCPVLDIPVHLRSLAKSQIPYWIKNAMKAAYAYKKDVHYTVQNERIVPIRYNETGDLQSNMVWSDGLTQFLQLKEGLSVDPEGIATNFISNVGFFKRYGCSVYGLTGTLGEPATRKFLSETYDTDMMIIPPYLHRPIEDNADTSYLCKALIPITLTCRVAWYKTIINRALIHARSGRAVLIICKYIRHVKYLSEQLRSQYDPQKIFPYTGEDTFSKNEIHAGEIVVATNIAGRGTDLITSQEVESHGGMYVAVTFLPESYRVEMQNMGRTARAGKKGMGQLIIFDPEGRSVYSLKKLRCEQEVLATNEAINDARIMLVQDRLFTEFCTLESQYFPSISDCELLEQWRNLKNNWEKYADIKLSPHEIAEYVAHRVSRRTDQLLEESLGKLSGEEMKKLSSVDQQRIRNKAVALAQSEKNIFESKYRSDILNRFCHNLSNVPQNLIACLREQREFQPVCSELAKKYDWGLYERKGFEEHWGLWLKEQHIEDKGLSQEEAISLFESSFCANFKVLALDDRLVQNPNFYVLKGNEYLNHGALSSAIECYDRAISMDATFSVNARYNKARALLMLDQNKGEYQKRAYNELKLAKEIIFGSYRPSLLAFNALVSPWTDKCHTSEHVQHQLNLLNQQESFISGACQAIEEAQEKDRDVKLTIRLVDETVNLPDGDPSKAVREAAVNGLTHFFTIESIEPIPWGTVVNLALIGVTEMAAGCIITVYTANPIGAALISEGISDIINCVKSVLQRDFSMGAWAAEKAINLAVSLVASGVKAIKSGAKCISAAARKITAGIAATKSQLNLAVREVATALGKGVAKEILTSVGQWSTDKLFMEDFEKKIRNRVEESIMQALRDNAQVMEALKLDVQNGNNYWQNLFIKEGLSILKEDLKEEKNRMWAYIAKETASRVVAKKVECISSDKIRICTQATLLATRAATVVTQAESYMSDFISKFNGNVKLYEKDILNASEKLVQRNSQITVSPNVEHEFQTAEAPAVDLEESDVVVDSTDAATCYASQIPENSTHIFHSGISPSDPKSVVKIFSDQIADMYVQDIKHHLVYPIMNAGIGKLSHAFFKETDEVTANLRMQMRTYADRQDHSNELAVAQQKEVVSGSSNRDGTSIFCQNENIAELNESAQEGIRRIREGSDLDETDLSLAAAIADAPVRVHEKETGKLVEIVGQELQGKPISLVYSKADDSGHWEPLDSSILISPSGENNCLVDSVLAQISPEKMRQITDASAFKEKMIEYVYDHTNQANEAYATRDKLKLIAPEELRIGGKGRRGRSKSSGGHSKNSTSGNSHNSTKHQGSAKRDSDFHKRVNELHGEVGRNSIKIPEKANDTERYRYDLKGRDHKDVPTPHVQREVRNERSDGEVFWNKDSRWVRPMTEKDLDVIEQHVRSGKKE